MADNIKKVEPAELVLKCYGTRLSSGQYFAVCLDFNLAVEADSIKEVKRKMVDAIESYVETVIDTKDKESIPALLKRPAPLQYWLKFYLVRIIKGLHNRFSFEEAIPFHLSHSC